MLKKFQDSAQKVKRLAIKSNALSGTDAEVREFVQVDATGDFEAEQYQREADRLWGEKRQYASTQLPSLDVSFFTSVGQLLFGFSGDADDGALSKTDHGGDKDTGNVSMSLSRKASTLRCKVEEAREFIDESINDPGEVDTDQDDEVEQEERKKRIVNHLKLKRALLSQARRLWYPGAQAVEHLAKWCARTPEFFVSRGWVAKLVDTSTVLHSKQLLGLGKSPVDRSPVERPCCPLHELHGAEAQHRHAVAKGSMDRIEALTLEATKQCLRACTDLLDILACDKNSENVRQHLVVVVLDRSKSLGKIDGAQMKLRGATSAMVAHWPADDAKESGDPYDCIQSLLHEGDAQRLTLKVTKTESERSEALYEIARWFKDGTFDVVCELPSVVMSPREGDRAAMTRLCSGRLETLKRAGMQEDSAHISRNKQVRRHHLAHVELGASFSLSSLHYLKKRKQGPQCEFAENLHAFALPDYSESSYLAICVFLSEVDCADLRCRPEQVSKWIRSLDVEQSVDSLYESTGKGPPPPRLAARPTERCALERQVRLQLDEIWAQAVEKDRLIHMSDKYGRALRALRAMNRRAYRELQQEEYALYVFPGISSDHLHWINRRRAAARVCEMASKGNFDAVNLICSRMTKDASWIIRHMALTEACRMLVVASETAFGPFLSDVRQLLINTICDCIFQGPIRHDKESSNEKQDQTDEEVTVEALCSELPRCSADVLANLTDRLAICSQSAGEHERHWKPWYERVLHALRQTKEQPHIVASGSS